MQTDREKGRSGHVLFTGDLGPFNQANSRILEVMSEPYNTNMSEEDTILELSPHQGELTCAVTELVTVFFLCLNHEVGRFSRASSSS